MELHLESKRTLHFRKGDGTQGLLNEGSQAYMHFATSKKIDIWMLATVLALYDEKFLVQSDDGLRWGFLYSDLKDVRTQKPEAVERAEVERLINFLRPIPHPVYDARVPCRSMVSNCMRLRIRNRTHRGYAKIYCLLSESWNYKEKAM